MNIFEGLIMLLTTENIEYIITVLDIIELIFSFK